MSIRQSALASSRQASTRLRSQLRRAAICAALAGASAWTAANAQTACKDASVLAEIETLKGQIISARGREESIERTLREIEVEGAVVRRSMSKEEVDAAAKRTTELAAQAAEFGAMAHAAGQKLSQLEALPPCVAQPEWNFRPFVSVEITNQFLNSKRTDVTPGSNQTSDGLAGTDLGVDAGVGVALRVPDSPFAVSAEIRGIFSGVAQEIATHSGAAGFKAGDGWGAYGRAYYAPMSVTPYVQLGWEQRKFTDFSPSGRKSDDLNGFNAGAGFLTPLMPGISLDIGASNTWFDDFTGQPSVGVDRTARPEVFRAHLGLIVFPFEAFQGAGPGFFGAVAGDPPLGRGGELQVFIGAAGLFGLTQVQFQTDSGGGFSDDTGEALNGFAGEFSVGIVKPIKGTPIAAGLGLRYQTGGVDFSAIVDNGVNVFESGSRRDESIGVFGRLYATPCDCGAPYVELSVNSTQFTAFSPSGADDFRRNGVGLGAGFTAPIANGVALDMGYRHIFYQNQENDGPGFSNRTTYDDDQAYVGLTIFTSQLGE